MMNTEQEEILRMLLLRLENIQRDVGDVQRGIIELLGMEDTQAFTKPLSTAPQPAAAVEELEEEPDLATLQPEQTATPCINPVEWLKKRNITLLRTAPTGELDETFDRLALFLGERFQNIRPFYEALKRRVGGHPHLHAVKLTQASPRVISDICQFATDLHRNGFLSRCYYSRDTRTLIFDPQMDGRVVNFFTGEWLERYVLLTALERAEALLPEGTAPAKLTKAVVSLPDRQETELDILLGLPDRVIWMECKTGDWQEHAVKFGRIARHLGVPQHHAALVLLDPLTSEQKKNASALSRMTAVNPEELEEFVETALSANPAQPPADQTHPIVISGSDNAAEYIAWLKRRGMRPLDARVRRQIVSDLVRLNEKVPGPLPELERRLKDEYEAVGSHVSKNQISDVTSALRRAGLCLRQSHPDYPAGAWFLRGDVSADEMLKQCALLYLWTILKNPAWPSDQHLDTPAVAEIVRWDFNTTHDAAELIEQLLNTLGSLGKCQKQGDQWIAVGEAFVE